MRRVRRAAPSNMSTLAPTTSIVCSIAVAVPVFGITQLMHQNSQSRRDQRSRDHRGQQVLRSSREHRHQTNDNRKIRSCTVRIDGLSETQIFGGPIGKIKQRQRKPSTFPDCALQGGGCLLSHTLVKKLPRAIEGRRRVLSNQPIHAPSTKIPYHCRSC